MTVALEEDDSIARCIIFPRFFSEDQVHLDELLWRFENSGEDGCGHESGVLRRLVPEAEQVHQIGCGIAAIQNQTAKARRYYCGFRNAKYGAIPLNGPDYTLTVTNTVEHGQEAHLDFALRITVEGKSARNRAKANARIAIAEAFGPAIPHICDCDTSDAEHPFKRFGDECLNGKGTFLTLG
ncbi:hypothetical protein [Bradyrhizobium sp. HKCCYLRH3061]|uniref:hypothetical protein n=1 Tax=Bradyrhizobium sp. HKCCYLRH3061 TaxID=3420734 RepID=UPI003EB7708F